MESLVQKLDKLTQRVIALEENNQEVNPQTQEQIEELKEYLLQVLQAVNILTQRVAKLEKNYLGEDNNRESSEKTSTTVESEMSAAKTQFLNTWQDDIDKRKHEVQQRINTAKNDIEQGKSDIEQGIKKLGESLNKLFNP